MLYGLESGLQKRLERHGAYEMFQELKYVFQTHAHVERYETSDKYFSYKMEKNSSTSEHVHRISGAKTYRRGAPGWAQPTRARPLSWRAQVGCPHLVAPQTLILML